MELIGLKQVDKKRNCTIARRPGKPQDGHRKREPSDALPRRPVEVGQSGRRLASVCPILIPVRVPPSSGKDALGAYFSGDRKKKLARGIALVGMRCETLIIELQSWDSGRKCSATLRWRSCTADVQDLADCSGATLPPVPEMWPTMWDLRPPGGAVSLSVGSLGWATG